MISCCSWACPHALCSAAPSRTQAGLAHGLYAWPCRQHELELRKDKADVELLMMQQGLSATVNATSLPSKPEPNAQSGKASSKAVTALEQRLQLLTEEATQLRETIVKQAKLHICMAHVMVLQKTIPDVAPRPGYRSMRLCRVLLQR